MCQTNFADFLTNHTKKQIKKILNLIMRREKKIKQKKNQEAIIHHALKKIQRLLYKNP